MDDKKFSDEDIARLMAEMGRKGGKAGTGDSKIRGGKSYYRRIRKGLKGKRIKSKKKP